MTKHVYIAGPMRGYPEGNFPAFRAAAETLRAEGFTVWSPHEEDVWGRGHDGPKRAMILDLIHILTWADALVVLDGWERSVGARAEVATALWAGVPVYEYASRLEITSTDLSAIYYSVQGVLSC